MTHTVPDLAVCRSGLPRLAARHHRVGHHGSSPRMPSAATTDDVVAHFSNVSNVELVLKLPSIFLLFDAIRNAIAAIVGFGLRRH
mgnify:CR=1 FL=1